MTAKLIPLTDEPHDEEVTVYVKGFLGRGETAGSFDAWLESHRDLVASHGWAPHAAGYHWEAGRVRKLAMPVASGAKMAWDLYRVVRHTRRINPLATAGWFLAEQGAVLSARFVGQFIEARRHATERADDLAARLEQLSQAGHRVRVVAHSLGCRQVIEASALLPGPLRPHEIHLCAPACLEGEVEDKLDHLAREQAHLYYSGLDQVLELSFRAMSQGRAIGAVGLERDYAGLRTRDVSESFDFWVHTEYKNRLGRLVEHPEDVEVDQS